MPWQDDCSRIRIVGGNGSGSLDGEQMGDNLEFFADDFGLFLVICLLYYYISHIQARRAL